MEKVDVLTELKETGYDVLLLSSFTSDLILFERVILRHLLESNCRYIGLFLDGKMVVENFEQSLMEIGKSYVVQPIYSKGAFHPKLYLLLGENKAKVIIGSGNLTPSGLITNTEVFNIVSYEKNNEEYLSIIQDVFHFFLFYHNTGANTAMRNIIDFCDKYSYLKMDAPVHTQLSFLHNGFISIHDQLKSIITGDLLSIDVIAPYFDKTLSVYDFWKKDFKPAHVNYLIQNETSNFPVQLPVQNHTSRFLLDFQDSEYKNKRYHGKIFFFKGFENDVTVYGSANFSSVALIKSYTEGGNAEAVLVEIKPAGSFNSFFVNEINRLEMPQTFISLEEDFTDNNYYTVSVLFLEANLTSKELVMVLKSSQEILEVKINNISGTLKRQTGIYTIKWDKALVNLTAIFSYSVLIRGEELLLTGWFHDSQKLSLTQNNKSLLTYKNLEQDPYLTDYQNLVNILEDLLERLSLTEEDLATKNTFKNMTTSIVSKLEMNDEAVPVSEDVDDYYVSDEELAREAYGSIGGVNVLDELIKQFLKPLFDENDGPTNNNGSINISQAQGERAVLDEATRRNLQRQMKRFAKRFREGITAASYLDKVPEEVLLTNMTLYNQFLLKMFQFNRDVPYVTQLELIDELYQVIQKMIEYGKKNIIQHPYFSEILLPQSLAIIVARDILIDHEENLYLVRNYRKSLKNHMYEMNKYIYPLSDYYNEHTEKIRTYLESMGFNLASEEIVSRIDKLIPFTTRVLFLEWLQDKEREFELVEGEGILLRIYTHLNLGANFNLDQVIWLAKMLSVEEWEEELVFNIEWVNNDLLHNLEKYILHFNKNEKVLQKTFSYRNHLSPIVSRKGNVFSGSITDAAEKGDSQYMGEGFK